ncbi:MAG: Cof-type HAD-IIB family hydrolase [Acidimicrobiia bacterium]|nr:Cof-type HAD-IIB family hydrolase [Acidimicrobiia bacterium]MCY4435049.1 HAD hydrolase family protein [bacterium]
MTDLDRTFWGLDCVAPAAHLDALVELEAAGHVVLAATGRRLQNISRLFDLNGLELPAVALDGSVGMDFATKERFHRIAFDPAALWKLLDILEVHGIRPCLYIDDHGEPGGDVAMPENPSSEPSHLRFLDEDVNHALSPVDVEADVLELVLTGLPSHLAHLAAKSVHSQSLGVARVDEPDPLYGGSRLTVSPPGVSKVSGVEAFCQWTGQPFDFAAIGDGINDLELLEAASISIAIANSHASQAANPDHIIDSPERGGWATVPRLVIGGGGGGSWR